MATKSIEISRPFRLGGFATGNYMCKCAACGEGFTGDKRAIQCLPCASEQAAARLEALQPSPETSLQNMQTRGAPGREEGPVAWLCTNKASGRSSLRFEPIPDLPFNRANWTWKPLYASPTVEGGEEEEGSARADLSSASRSPELHSDGRSATDYAIEHGGYLADTVSAFLKLAGEESVFGEVSDHGLRETVSDYLQAMQSGVYEFEKRVTRAKALSGAQRSELSGQLRDEQNPLPAPTTEGK